MAGVLPFPVTQQQRVPFTTFVTKVVSRCNLNCSYCYMYNLEDGTWRNQPGVMSEDVTRALALRVGEHAVRHGVPSVHLILHGGEPLLMGKGRLARWVNLIRETLPDSVTPYFSVQSNGVLVDDQWVDVLAASEVRIGISVDGPRPYHDRFRLDHEGRGSFDRVLHGIRTLQNHARGREIFSTVMAVVDTGIPPLELFDFWQELNVIGFDLSLPHANWEHRPPLGAMSYGDWMIEFFDLWLDQNRPDRRIRYFDNMLRMLFQYPISTDNIGGRPVGVVVVETDGSIEPTDAFKCCEEGITKIGLNVTRSGFDDLYGLPMIDTLQGGAPMLCATCQACDVRDVCGGGYMPHRYKRGPDFDNPSVYCEDLEKLIRHIRLRVVDSLPADVRERLAL